MPSLDRYSLLLAIFFVYPTFAASSPLSAEADEAKQCRALKERAHREIGRLRSTEDEVSPVIRGLEILGQAIELCWEVATSTKDPELAAEMAAETYLSKERLSLLSLEDRQRGKEILSEGIQVVRGLHNDRSPALIELLERSAFAEVDENPRRGRQLMELSVEIAGETYGLEDVRYAQKVADLGFLYAPRSDISDRKGVDPQEAERLYRMAIGIFLQQENPAAHEGLTSVLSYLKDLLEVEGRAEEAADIRAYFGEVLAEQERLQEDRKAAGAAAAEEATPSADSAGEGDGSAASDRRGETAALDAKTASSMPEDLPE